MKKIFSVILVGILVLPSYANAATPKLKACSKSQVGKVKNDHTCTKINKVYRWVPVEVKETKSEVPVPVKTISKKYFSSICEFDSKFSSVWDTFVRSVSGTTNCFSQLDIPTTTPISQAPTTKQFFSSVDIDRCKIKQGEGAEVTAGFPDPSLPGLVRWFNNTRHPSPNTVYQIIPIYTNDIPNSKTSPAEDYKRYFEFLTNFTKQASDNGSSIQIRVPKEYINVPVNIKSYTIRHESPRNEIAKFTKDLSRYVDPIIDFSGSNVALVVFPPSTNKIIEEQVPLGTLDTKESFVRGAIMTSHTITGYGQNFAFPMWWIHELNHSIIGFGDNSWEFKDSSAWWGVNNWASAMDQFTWNKWLAGFISDKQVLCIDGTKNADIWITPSTLNGSSTKMAVIPLSNSKAIIIESQRAVGINYKLPEISEGVLIYTLDINKVNGHDNFRLVLPKNKTMIDGPNISNSYSGKNSNAVLKLNETSGYNGITFKVIEAGDFGDVIRITVNG